MRHRAAEGRQADAEVETDVRGRQADVEVETDVQGPGSWKVGGGQVSL